MTWPSPLLHRQPHWPLIRPAKPHKATVPQSEGRLLACMSLHRPQPPVALHLVNGSPGLSDTQPSQCWGAQHPAPEPRGSITHTLPTRRSLLLLPTLAPPAQSPRPPGSGLGCSPRRPTRTEGGRGSPPAASVGAAGASQAHWV